MACLASGQRWCRMADAWTLDKVRKERGAQRRKEWRTKILPISGRVPPQHSSVTYVVFFPCIPIFSMIHLHAPSLEHYPFRRGST